MGDIAQGAGASLTYNFSRYLGLEADYGGNKNNNGSVQHRFDRTSAGLAHGRRDLLRPHLAGPTTG